MSGYRDQIKDRFSVQNAVARSGIGSEKNDPVGVELLCLRGDVDRKKRALRLLREEKEMNSETVIKSIMESKAGSYWLKNAIRTAMQRDPVDALGDAEVLANVLKMRWDEMKHRGKMA